MASSFHWVILKLLLFLADQKTILISFKFILLREGILIPYYAVITLVAVTTGSATYQSSMYLFDTKKVRIAHQWQNMEQIMLFCEFSIRTLREMVSCYMVIAIIGFIDIYKSCRIFSDVPSVSVT